MLIIRLAPVLAWMGVIFALSSMSGPPGASGRDWLSVAAHVVEYAVLAFLLSRFMVAALPGRRARALAVAWLIAAAYGASDEWHQSFVPNRDPSFFDLAADATGAAFGGVLWSRISAMEWIWRPRRALPHPRETTPD